MTHMRTADTSRSSNRDMQKPRSKEVIRQVARKTLIQNFRKAAEGLGRFCPVHNELLMRKGRKAYRFICNESNVRLVVSDQPEVTLLISCDATPDELRGLFASVGDLQ